MGDGKEPAPLARDRPAAATSPEELGRARPPAAERCASPKRTPGSGSTAEAAAPPSPGTGGMAAELPRAAPSWPALSSSLELFGCVDSPSVLGLPLWQAQQLYCPESSSPSI